MKTKEELSAIKEEVETLNKKLAELTGEELKEVTGGFIGYIDGFTVDEGVDRIEEISLNGLKRPLCIPPK